MNAFTTAVVSYVITGLISFFVAGLIQLMVLIMKRLPKAADVPDDGNAAAPVEAQANHDAEIAAVIAIAKNC